LTVTDKEITEHQRRKSWIKTPNIKINRTKRRGKEIKWKEKGQKESKIENRENIKNIQKIKTGSDWTHTKKGRRKKRKNGIVRKNEIKDKNNKTERQKDRKTERQKDRKTERQKDRETERQKDRKTELKREFLLELEFSISRPRESAETFPRFYLLTMITEKNNT
jgi:hypothetical protein